MKQVLRYAIFPGVIMAVVGEIVLRLSKYFIDLNELINDDSVGLIVILFFVISYITTITFSSILSRREFFVTSVILVLLSTLVRDFTDSLILGISNQFGQSLNGDVLLGPILSKYNYVLINQPVLILFAAVLAVGITKKRRVIFRYWGWYDEALRVIKPFKLR